MKPLLILLTLVAGVGLGVLGNRRFRPAAIAAEAVPGRGITAVPAPPGMATALTAKTHGGVGLVVGKRSPKVKLLLTGFDRRKPLQSQLAVLEKIMAASPGDLAAMAMEMTREDAGSWRGDPGWWQTKTAILQRWVELAPDQALEWASAAQRNGRNYSQGVEVFGMLANVDPTRAMAAAQQLVNPAFRNSAIQSVVGSISQADPEQAFRLGQALPREQRGGVLATVFSNWADRNPAAAAAGLLTLEDWNERGQAASALMNRWASQDPASALAWAKGLAEPGMRQDSLRAYFGMIGRRDPETAIAQISEFPRSQQHGFFSNLAGDWMRTDPDAATAWILSRPNAVEQQQLIVAAARNLGYMAGEQAAQLVSRLTPGSAREQALNRIVGQWTWRDPDAAVAFTKTLPAAEETRLRERVVQGLANQDPEKAIAYLKTNPIDDPASEVWASLAGTMAETSSPAKALEWANALPDEISRRRALPGIFSQMAQQNPAEAARQAAALPDEAARLECLANVAGAWAGAGMEEALGWAQGLAGKDREAAMGAVLSQGAPQQPTVAAEQFDALIGGVPAGTKPADALLGAAGAIASAYFAENEQAAAQWAASLTQEDARTAAVTSLAQQWMQYDPAGASEWIGTLPAGESRDGAVGQLIGKVAPSDPASAFAWASTVADSGDRSNLLQTTFEFWRKLDAPAARTAIEAADWPDAEKTKWLDKVK